MTRALLVAYILVGIIVYGHSFRNDQTHVAGKVVKLEAVPLAVKGVVCGAFWPLYLSVILWEEK